MRDDVPYSDWQGSLDEEANPCENFYKFACGRYEKEHKILFELLFKLNLAIASARPYLELCLVDAILDTTPTNSTAVQKMRSYRDVFVPIKNIPLAPQYKRWVAEKTANLFPVVANHVFVHYCFGPDVLKRVQEIATEIKFTVAVMIYEADWLDSKTKDAALDKLAKMREYVGAIDIVINARQLDILHESLEIKPKEPLFSMEQKIKKFNTKKFGAPELDGFGVTEVNAFNELTSNVVFIIAGFINQHNFDLTNAAAINYGRIGSVIGHEIFHAFDDTGIQFDGKGTQRNWWTAKSLVEYKKRAQCYVDQYGKQIDTKTGKHLNGTLTLGENIADNNGMKAAYRTYLRHLHEQRLLQVPGYSQYDFKKAFFISYGTLWCYSGSKVVHDYLLKNAHPPFEFRVNVPLENFQDFADVFNCSTSSPMNPANKCTLF
ncbi:hypothetical protein M3Y97_01077400 [Aphelenchoides bicaudatus]|nr:hypothetical protein M3Y97_01077400 [Aphelenchoides bicaudatus]